METKRFEFTSFSLHVLAMITMLMDHTWSCLLPSWEWLTCVGRITFPIFAFMTVEGFFHTHNFKKYCTRMLVFALISEIPFDLMYNGAIFYPYHQNVMWTFLIALLGMKLMETMKLRGILWQTVLVDIVVVLVCVLMGFAFFVDYYGTGIMLVFVFYFFHGRKWWCFLGQFLGMYYLNVEVLGGYYYPINLFGFQIELVQQSIAMLALIPIWLYRGKQGYHSKPFQYFCYAFYPGHILVLYLIGLLGMMMH